MEWHEGNIDLIADAKLAAAAYHGHNEVDGWQRDVELSNIDRSVYTKEGKAVVAYSGTRITGKHKWRDLGTDILIGIGAQDVANRFKTSRKTAELAAAKYGKENVRVTGHSLGGSIAQHVSHKTGLKATGFSAAMSPVDILARKRTYKHFTSVSTSSDPISLFTRQHSQIGRKHHRVRSKVKGNPHAMQNYLP